MFNSDADVSEESPPPLPERTPESFVLADMPVRPEWHELPNQEWSEQRESEVSRVGTGIALR